ncbi:MAG: hypothetical protein KZQ66_01430 [Candidatus Thiodiazotropha sp. (ex Lucinoma aequizonata)]|nr:hypothetical protein [Candidatus Thiodiazotropha sp. (ex Lucinoma aequizonata)]MCU7897967.1 hypothetical protein [Candidatus Thiodiazotropha sp. (ex Lucinoma aequizonata)]MCU7900835.1 hypothetical protein [Candidatus Thiodiazotropha sp. (ex Lucinoma aequizonata)]MCU7907969.1 hypothetical protein [Candidatus Thiodiazotropha sp. (ex Lucinoma aequizonata)]MCU7911511.1 hypothetical protein [Candidatus Thiodiazotropha sp. (ex Lucinoma aequizonata)]
MIEVKHWGMTMTKHIRRRAIVLGILFLLPSTVFGYKQHPMSYDEYTRYMTDAEIGERLKNGMIFVRGYEEFGYNDRDYRWRGTYGEPYYNPLPPNGLFD